MIHQCELWVLRELIQRGWLSKEMVKQSLWKCHETDKRLIEYLFERGVLSYEVWQSLWKELEQRQDWPNHPLQIRLENQILYVLLQRSPLVELGRFNNAFLMATRSVSPLRLDEVLLSAGMIDKKVIREVLGIRQNQYLFCPFCEYQIRLDRHYSWKPYPCLFCNAYLVACPEAPSSGESKTYL